MRNMRKRYGRSSGGRGPSREWVSLSTGWALLTVASTTATPLMQLQAPTMLNLTSDPPEDLTVLRVVGSFNCLVSDPGGSWTLALVVQDTTWTPSAFFADDADKRILWSRTFRNGAAMGAEVWTEPGVLTSQGSRLPFNRDTVTVDITPKVKLEAGKALYLVAYEQDPGSTLTTGTEDMRLLFQRSGRR